MSEFRDKVEVDTRKRQIEERRDQLRALLSELKEESGLDPDDEAAVEQFKDAINTLFKSEADRLKREDTVVELVRMLAESVKSGKVDDEYLRKKAEAITEFMRSRPPGKPRNIAAEIDAIAERVRKIEETIEQFKVGFKVVGDNLHAAAEKMKAATAKLEAEFSVLIEDLKREAAGGK